MSGRQIDADNKLSEVIEWQLINGWPWVRPEDVGSLTEAPILTEDVDDQGNVHSAGTVYWYPQYDASDPVAKLLQCIWRPHVDRT